MMTRIRRCRYGMALCMVPMLGCVAVGGCRKEESRANVVSLKGRIESIKRTSDQAGTLSVLYYNEKQDKEVLGTAIVTADTEIMIGGAVAKFSDLREGDRVKGEVRILRKGDKKMLSVLKIRVDRRKPSQEGG